MPKLSRLPLNSCYLSSSYQRLKACFCNHKIKWRSNLGFFKQIDPLRCLEILKNAKLTYHKLSTVVVELECVLNSRPENTVELLSPCLLTGRREFSLFLENLQPLRKTKLIATFSQGDSVIWLHCCLTCGIDRGANSWLSIAPGDIVARMEEGKTKPRFMDTQKDCRGASMKWWFHQATMEVASSTGERRCLRRPSRYWNYCILMSVYEERQKSMHCCSGSCLGPLLFIIYALNLSKIVLAMIHNFTLVLNLTILPVRKTLSGLWINVLKI